ncbi:hypothetical protein WJX84_011500 [Apatococcus fuscideae]|uniref:Sorting nexin C-terminal domain-containing protein n=1 Tax=Apatococcus fuscideae TaxID=2026836 RepID=A0AAW1RR80_9CHLO
MYVASLLFNRLAYSPPQAYSRAQAIQADLKIQMGGACQSFTIVLQATEPSTADVGPLNRPHRLSSATPSRPTVPSHSGSEALPVSSQHAHDLASDQSAPSSPAAHLSPDSSLRASASWSQMQEAAANAIPEGLAWEESAGISAPLLDIVDVLFNLQSHGFFRRQVFGAARQMLSLVAGGKIDEWLLGHLRGLRDEHFVARMLHALESVLWPGGVWFLHAQHADIQAPRPEGTTVPPTFMSASRFGHTDPPPAAEADAVSSALWKLLVLRAPPALVRIIGTQVYQSGVRDLYDMMQSATFMQHIGYGALKILLTNIFPELRHKFLQIEGAIQHQSAAA